MPVVALEGAAAVFRTLGMAEPSAKRTLPHPSHAEISNRGAVARHRIPLGTGSPPVPKSSSGQLTYAGEVTSQLIISIRLSLLLTPRPVPSTEIWTFESGSLLAPLLTIPAERTRLSRDGRGERAQRATADVAAVRVCPYERALRSPPRVRSRKWAA